MTVLCMGVQDSSAPCSAELTEAVGTWLSSTGSRGILGVSSGVGELSRAQRAQRSAALICLMLLQAVKLQKLCCRCALQPCLRCASAHHARSRAQAEAVSIRQGAQQAVPILGTHDLHSAGRTCAAHPSGDCSAAHPTQLTCQTAPWGEVSLYHSSHCWNPFGAHLCMALALCTSSMAQWATPLAARYL